MAALCPLPDNHFKRNSGDRRVVRGEGAGAAAPPDRLRLSEALADEVLALRPERLCAIGVERIGTHAGPDAVAIVDFSDLAILAIATADRVRLGDGRRPDRCRGALRDRFLFERRFSRGFGGRRDLLEDRKSTRLNSSP